MPWFAVVGGCGGTLVAPDRVLTAAHCVGGRTPEMLGGISVGGVARLPTHIAMHPGWRHRNGPENFLDDVAVVELDQPVTGVSTVALGGAEPTVARILGSGRPFAPGTGHSESEMYDSTLRTADLRLIGDRACALAFRGYEGETSERFDPRMRCAIDADGLPPLYSGCHGDSGGPLWTGTPEAPVQLGIVSWGGKCGADHRPSVFADVTLYRDFITDPSPTWAPTKAATGLPRISGTRRVGRRLRCSVPGYTPEAGAKLQYSWKRTGAFHGGTYRPGRTLGEGRAYIPTRSDRGRRVACQPQATNDGGYIALGVANVLIRR